jgi:hypothetical protein
MMKIELRRALEPGELVETPCGLCGAPFEGESIVAAVVGGGADLKRLPVLRGALRREKPGEVPAHRRVRRRETPLPRARVGFSRGTGCGL